MPISISPISNNLCYKSKAKPSEVARTNKSSDDNPISRKGEVANLTKATFIGGLALGGRLLWEILIDGDFLIEDVAKAANKIVEKNKKEIAATKKSFLKVGAFFALLAAFVSGVAIIKTLYDAPKIAYDSKVNAFKKSKEMDVYTKANEAEKNLYEELDNKAKESTAAEKEELKEQYLKLKNAKNQVPDFVNIK